ncbi:large conductance mechanosensitive channel protein MscL [Spiractinospora alimapuensis]|uniref:large conductance mechanosensitive channel protein MscL n=1 Tax=Spiractinospora alimapuensis TaxID=2820884 RepID=UPI001EEA04E8|nr:large conductance mechanosensitive channel protein MscL [Spiractinospora alimapuensis]QVQ51334.1 large conductance mechanosensitive channel protein MscL [Spiractinospora alimapuensis]
MSGFRKFLLQGNLIQLAVAVVIGAAFGDLITAFTKGFITPLLGIFGGVPEFSDLYFEINGSQFLYGAFVDAVIAFVIIAAILYFLVVLPMGALYDRMTRLEESTTRECPECRSEIPNEATRCSQCTVQVTPQVAT